jgi:hypothetical protein
MYKQHVTWLRLFNFQGETGDQRRLISVRDGDRSPGNFHARMRSLHMVTNELKINI